MKVLEHILYQWHPTRMFPTSLGYLFSLCQGSSLPPWLLWRNDLRGWSANQVTEMSHTERLSGLVASLGPFASLVLLTIICGNEMGSTRRGRTQQVGFSRGKLFPTKKMFFYWRKSIIKDRLNKNKVGRSGSLLLLNDNDNCFIGALRSVQVCA